MNIYLGADHGGFALKNTLIAWLIEQKYDIVDCGNTKLEPTDDFPDFAFAVADAVAGAVNSTPGVEARGILLCRSSGGVMIAANKVKGIRAVTGVHSTDVAHNRDHNDANVLAIAGDYTSEDEAKKLITIFLTTPWAGAERMARRLDKIKAREAAWSK